MIIRKLPYEVTLMVGMYGVAILDINEPAGVIELHLQNSGYDEWYHEWIIPVLKGELKTGKWVIRGLVLAEKDDLDYTVDETVHYE